MAAFKTISALEDSELNNANTEDYLYYVKKINKKEAIIDKSESTPAEKAAAKKLHKLELKRTQKQNGENAAENDFCKSRRCIARSFPTKSIAWLFGFSRTGSNAEMKIIAFSNKT